MKSLIFININTFLYSYKYFKMNNYWIEASLINLIIYTFLGKKFKREYHMIHQAFEERTSLNHYFIALYYMFSVLNYRTLIIKLSI